MAVEAPLDHDAETVEREEFRHRTENAAGQKLEARIRALIGIAGRLALLDHRDQLVELRIILADHDAAPLQGIEEVGLAALVGHHHLAVIADQMRLHMLIGAGVLQQRRGMDAGLGGKGGGTDIGQLVVGRAVEQFIEGMGEVGNARQPFGIDAESRSGWHRSPSAPVSG